MESLPLEPRQSAIRKLVQTTYESPDIVSRYDSVGFWPSEETLVLDFLPDDARVVDIGCGTGRTTIALAEIGLQVSGIDISKNMIRVAGRHSKFAKLEKEIDLHVMDVMSMAFSDSSFDFALFSYNGIELLPGRSGKELALREITRILKPNGYLVLSTHSPYAFNINAPGRLGALCRFLLGKFFGVPVKEQEAGERFLDDEWEEARYLQILPPSTIIRIIMNVGLQLEYYNTRKRIEEGRNSSRLSAIEDGERFYVAKKPDIVGC